jgi:hypothetical protein
MGTPTRANSAKKGTPPRWQFCWCDADSPPANGDAHTWKSKTFRAATFAKAMGKMLAFVRGKPFDCLVDYECRAEHVAYRGQVNHDKAFPRIDTTDHELGEYVG